jgi:alanine racemase
VDVGLFRAGAMPADAPQLFETVKRLRKLEPRGLYSHFFSYGAEPTPNHFRWQFSNMRSAAAAAIEAGLRLPIAMVSSTSAVLDFPEMDMTGIDPGRVIYGLGQARTDQRPAKFRPALIAFKTRLLMRKSLGAVDTGGFPAPFAVRAGMTIGVLPIGWGDGLPRKLPDGAAALIRGQQVPLLNPVHLEHLRIDLSGVPDARPGDEVVLIGRQDGLEIPLAEVAQSWGIDATTFHGQMRDHIWRRYLRSGQQAFA